MVTSGDHHMLSIDTDGMLWAWGDNCYGQLCCSALDKGEGETQLVLVPPATFDRSKVAYVEASSESTMVVTADSVLWVCGPTHAFLQRHKISATDPLQHQARQQAECPEPIWQASQSKAVQIQLLDAFCTLL